MLSNWQRWAYYSQWLIAAGAAAQCWQTGLWLHLQPVSIWLVIFVFCSTLLLYLFHFRFYWIKKPLTDRQYFFTKHRRLMFAQFILGLIIAVIAFYKTRYHVLLPVTVIGMCACAYTYFIFKPRHYGIFRYNGIFKILTLSFVWMAVTSVLPVAAAGMQIFSSSCMFYYTFRWLFMLAICLPFDVRDMQQDKKSGNKTVPALIGQKNTFWLCYLCLALHVLLPMVGMAIGWYDGKLVAINVIATAVTAYCIFYSSRHVQDDFSWFLLDSNFVLRAVLVASVLIF